MKAWIGIFVAMALAACSTPSDVVKTGDNAYRYRPLASAGSAPTDDEIKARGIARAHEYCEAKGERAVVTVGQVGHFLSLPTAQVNFFCDDRPASRSATKTASSP